ncbi:MAG: hypothetical protein KAQ87_00425 [Candidatus Pacebacteria bacterium]|nr:hypothetical protein [Candidatus Paceibacterota bacterium]
MENSIVKLLKSGKTVFDTKDLSILWKISDKNTLKSKIYYLTKSEKIRKLHYGVYAVDSKYDKYELAGKLKHPSYVSMETVLRNEGCIFQYSEEIICVSNLNRNYICDGVKYSYRKIKDEVLYNKAGIFYFNYYSIASKERAFLDLIYLNKNYYFDNLNNINWDECAKIVKIYNNKSLIKRLTEYKKLC